MKKILFITLAFIFTNNVEAQNATGNKNSGLKKNTILLSNKNYKVYKDNFSGEPVDQNLFYKNSASRQKGGDKVGNTSYDLPTNGSSPNRLLVYPDNKASAAWTGSTSLTADRLDRGTFYNYLDGDTWGAFPEMRIEDYRTGFPALINVGDHEMFFAHDGTNNIAIFENESPGSYTWTENINSLNIHGSWPRAAHADGSDYIHLLVANDDAANENDYMIYYRSPDGGVTWDIQGYRLPGIDTANGYNIMGAECYAIRAIGNNVYIAAGESINDLAVWKSESNGDIGTWTRTELIEWPLPNFDGNTISDLTGDGVADTITTHDGTISLLIDNSGMMHVWAGVTYILDTEIDDDGWNYFPGVAGMWYWNESFGADSVQYLDFTLVDWDEDGDPFSGIGADLPNYGCGFTSQSSAALDPETGNIYITYTHPVEYTDYFDDPTVSEAQSFRDIFGFYSTDNGNIWSAPINLTYVAEQHFENVNPTSYWNTINDKVHVLWMQDQEPGNSLETETPDAISNDNDILYRAFDFSRFEPYDPMAEFDYTLASNVLTLNNLSVDASNYTWDFGDGATSSQDEPTHIFLSTGTYVVCLNAFNKYGDDQNCKTVDVTQVNISETLMADLINVFPTITTGEINIQISNLEEPVNYEIINLEGRIIKPITQLVNNEKINISGNAGGQYLIRFVSHSGVAIKPVTLVN